MDNDICELIVVAGIILHPQKLTHLVRIRFTELSVNVMEMQCTKMRGIGKFSKDRNAIIHDNFFEYMLRLDVK